MKNGTSILSWSYKRNILARVLIIFSKVLVMKLQNLFKIRAKRDNINVIKKAEWECLF